MKKLFTLFLFLYSLHTQAQIISLDTVCAGTPVTFTSADTAVTYTWDFNSISVVQTPSAIAPYYATGGTPTWVTFDNDGGNYYSFTTDYTTGNVTRLSYGTNIYSTPTVTNLGNFGATVGSNTEGIDIVQDKATGLWYGLVVNYTQMIVLSFGASLASTPTSTITTYSQLSWPHQVTLKKYNGNWSAFVANRNTSIVRFDFGASITSIPTVTVIPNVGGVANPCNFSLYEQSGNWYMLITNLINGSLSMYSFGTNLLNNAPTGTLIAPAGTFDLPRPVNILTDCNNNLIAYMETEPGEIYKFDFAGNITNTPVITPIGASGTVDVNSSAPCAYDDSFSLLLVNYSGNIVKYYPLYFSAPSFVDYYNPSQSYTFTTPGTYNISLFCDMGYPSGPSVFCKTIDVIACSTSCFTNSLIINTGYNPVTGLAVTPVPNLASPVGYTDPHWTVTGISTAAYAGIAAAGSVPVTLGANADVILEDACCWAAYSGLPGQVGNWINCNNANYYEVVSAYGPYDTYQTFTRPFYMCSDDTVKVDINIANDNYCGGIWIDGNAPYYSQTPPGIPGCISTFLSAPTTLYLAAGWHNINVEVVNYNVASGDNWTGLGIWGTVSSVTGSNSIAAENDTTCVRNCYPSVACNNSLTVPDSLKLCLGDTATIDATLSGTDSVFSYSWTPATGLSSTTILDPVITATTSGWYYLTVESVSPNNLVVNGNFAAGNTGFTSSYTYVPNSSGCLVPEDVYAICTDPYPDHPAAYSFGSYPPGGNMMAINGASTPISVWCETIPVTANTNYDFSAWVANWSSADVGTGVPVLQFMINGILIGTPDAITAAPATWVNFFATWNSGTSTTANICIYDETTAADGNDFALDDITFQQICIATDSVYVQANIPDTTYTHTDTTVCANVTSITLTAGSGYISYLWSTGSTASSITVSTTGSYWVYDSSVCAMLADTFDVNFKALPVIALGNDTSFCQGDSVILTSVQPAGDTLLWSTGSTGDTIHVSTSGTYTLTVSNGCVNSASINVLVSPIPLVNLGPDTANCSGQAIVLQSLYTYIGATYLWSNGTTGVTTSVTSSGIYWLQVTIGGCPGADTINVTIAYDTFTLYNTDTSICKNKSIQVLATGNTAIQTYQWTPTSGILSSNIINPLITPDTSATYMITIYYPGCPDIYDSFHIDVQPNPTVYLGGNRSVCDYDTVHINASVTPQWYTGYIYSWSPSSYLDNTTLPTVVFTAGDTSEIILTVTTPAGCIGTDSAEIIVYTDSFVHYDTSFGLCPGDSVQLLPVSNSVPTTYLWHPAIYMSDSASSAPWVYPITSQSYWGIATSQYGCHDTVTANITVRANAVLYLGDSVTLYPGQSYQISPQTNCTSFLWFPPAGLSDAYISNPIADPVISTKYIVYGTTEWGCIATDSIDIYVDPGSLLAVPNAFTPGNGPDNVFKIIVNGLATLNYFRIYNRWGNLVYESSNINAGWDGSYNGQPQPFDVYVYEIEAVTSIGTVFHKTGNVTLIR